MKTEVRWSEQVNRFVCALAPDQKEALRAGIRGLASDQGDIRALTDELMGYQRLRIGDFRVIYREHFEKGIRIRNCLFAERRNVVYEVFRRMALDDIW